MGKESLKEKLQKKRKELKSKGGNNKFIFLKAGETVRGRIVPTDGDGEFIKEVEHFYLGTEVGGIISPHTIGMPCALYDKYQELKKSKDPDDKDLAGKMTFKTKYLVPILPCTSAKGGEYEPEVKYMLISSGMYSSIIDLFLDEDEWGDMTDWEEGYDLKFSREGSGKMDTTYEVKPCKPSAVPKKFRLKDGYSIEEAIKDLVPSFEKTEEYVAKFMGTGLGSEDEEEDEDMGVRKKKDKKDKKKGKGLKKHKRGSEDEEEDLPF